MSVAETERIIASFTVAMGRPGNSYILPIDFNYSSVDDLRSQFRVVEKHEDQLTVLQEGSTRDYVLSATNPNSAGPRNALSVRLINNDDKAGRQIIVLRTDPVVPQRFVDSIGRGKGRDVNKVLEVTQTNFAANVWVSMEMGGVAVVKGENISDVEVDIQYSNEFFTFRVRSEEIPAVDTTQRPANTARDVLEIQNNNEIYLAVNEAGQYHFAVKNAIGSAGTPVDVTVKIYEITYGDGKDPAQGLAHNLDTIVRALNNSLLQNRQALKVLGLSQNEEGNHFVFTPPAEISPGTPNPEYVKYHSLVWEGGKFRLTQDAHTTVGENTEAIEALGNRVGTNETNIATNRRDIDSNDADIANIQDWARRTVPGMPAPPPVPGASVSQTLGQLTNVNAGVDSAAIGDVLTRVSGAWAASTPVNPINLLEIRNLFNALIRGLDYTHRGIDVPHDTIGLSIRGIEEGQFLIWDALAGAGAPGRWVAENFQLRDLRDVSTAAIGAGKILEWNGSEFVFVDKPTGGTGGGAAIPPWVSGTTYSSGEFVDRFNIIFQRTGRNSSSRSDPADLSTLPGGSGAFEWIMLRGVRGLIFYDTRVAFPQGAIVVGSDGNLYRGNVIVPKNIDPVSHARRAFYWEQLTRVGVPVWRSGQSWALGAVCYYEGWLYRTRIAVPGGGDLSQRTPYINTSPWVRADITEWQENFSRSYRATQLVTRATELYVCLVTHNPTATNGPGQSATNWKRWSGGGGGLSVSEVDALIDAATISRLSDTTISSPTDGQTLVRRGSAWVNESRPACSLIAINGRPLNFNNIAEVVGLPASTNFGTITPATTSYDLTVDISFLDSVTLDLVRTRLAAFNANVSLSNVKLDINGNACFIKATNQTLDAANTGLLTQSLTFTITASQLDNVATNLNAEFETTIDLQTRAGGSGSFDIHCRSRIRISNLVPARPNPASWAQDGQAAPTPAAGYGWNETVLLPFVVQSTERNTAILGLNPRLEPWRSFDKLMFLIETTSGINAGNLTTVNTALGLVGTSISVGSILPVVVDTRAISRMGAGVLHQIADFVRGTAMRVLRLSYASGNTRQLTLQTLNANGRAANGMFSVAVIGVNH